MKTFIAAILCLCAGLCSAQTNTRANNGTFTGTLGVTGKITNSNWNSVRVVDGTTLTTIQACINALPAAGGVCQVPPGDPVTGKYLETLSANIVLKKNTVVQFLGGCIVTQGAFILSVPQGADDVSIFSPFVHSSDQGGNAQGCTFQGYTGAAAAVDIGSSAGFTYNTLIRGIHVNLASAQANAIGIRRTNEVGGPLEYDQVVFGPVSGQIGFQFVGTGALFDGTSNLVGLELGSSASATNNKGFQFTGTNQNGYVFVGGHANMGGSANGSVCIDAAAGASKIDLGGFYCDVAATGVTVESTTNTAVRGWFIIDSGVNLYANFAAGSFGNVIWSDARSISSQLVTDNGTAGTNSVTNGTDIQWNSRRWGVVSEAGGSGFQIVDKSDNSQAIAKGVSGATHIDSSAGNPVRFNQNTGSGCEFWNAGAAVLVCDAIGTLHPAVVNTVGLGTTALPFTSIRIGAAATNNINLTGTATAARTITLPDATGTVALVSGTGTFSCANVTPVTVNANTAADQTLMACTIPAGTLNTVGKTLSIQTAGVYSTPAASSTTVNIKAKLCTVSGCGSGTVINLVSITSAALGAIQATNDPFNLQIFVSTQTAGASAAFESHGNLTIDTAALTTAAEGVYADGNTATVGTIDSTAQLFLQVTGAFSAASASNSITNRQLTAESVN